MAFATGLVSAILPTAIIWTIVLFCIYPIHAGVWIGLFAVSSIATALWYNKLGVLFPERSEAEKRNPRV